MELNQFRLTELGQAEFLFQLFSLLFYCRRIVEIHIGQTDKIRENCTFQLAVEEYQERGKYYVTTHLPLTREGFVYQWRNDGAASDWSEDHQNYRDIYWFLKQTLLQQGASNPVILRLLNNLKRMAHWKKRNIDMR